MLKKAQKLMSSFLFSSPRCILANNCTRPHFATILAPQFLAAPFLVRRTIAAFKLPFSLLSINNFCISVRIVPSLDVAKPVTRYYTYQ